MRTNQCLGDNDEIGQILSPPLAGRAQGDRVCLAAFQWVTSDAIDHGSTRLSAHTLFLCRAVSDMPCAGRNQCTLHVLYQR